MYLSGLGACSPSETQVLQRGDEAVCRNMGGTVMGKWGNSDTLIACRIPGKCDAAPPPPPPPPNIGISTNVQSQVSPQVSPNFIQQMQPNNSPVGASTAQSAPFNAAADAAYGDMMRRMEEDRAKNEELRQQEQAALMDTLTALANKPAPKAAAAPAASVSYMPSAPSAPEPSAVATVSEHSDYTKYLPYAAVVAALAVAALMMTNKRKGKRNVH